jgi:hypothetical protein
MKRSLFFLSLVFVFCSCSSPFTAVIPESLNENKPTLNLETTSEIGVSLVSKEIGKIHDAIQIKASVPYRLGYAKKEFKEGTVLVHDLVFKNFNIYTPIDNKEYSIAISKIDGHMALYSQGSIFQMKPVPYTTLKLPVKEKEYFKQEFIYNGKVGNSLKFVYREFTDNYARPAFMQELQYDISESKIIGFKGLRIEIINVNNTSITYKVLNHFD